MTRRMGHDGWDTTDGTRRMGRDGWDATDGARLPRHDRWGTTGGTRRLGNDEWARRSGRTMPIGTPLFRGAATCRAWRLKNRARRRRGRSAPVVKLSADGHYFNRSHSGPFRYTQTVSKTPASCITRCEFHSDSATVIDRPDGFCANCATQSHLAWLAALPVARVLSGRPKTRLSTALRAVA